MKKIKVLIVDDSKLVREILGEVLAKYDDIEIVGAAEDAFVARDLIKLHTPDVITLDVEMPKMDGITFLRNLMRLRPMPVVMLSTLTTQGADITLEALELGAVDFIAKPRSNDLMGNLNEFNSSLYEKIKFAASVDLTRLVKQAPTTAVEPMFGGVKLEHEIIALGASTGGTEALRLVIGQMPKDSPPVIITQHIPESFSKRFAKRLNDNSAMTVHEARDGQQLLRGNVYVAPGSMHLTIVELKGSYQCRLNDSDPVNRHKPSVDVMYNSLLKLDSVKVYAGLLTGMGDDGAQGLLALKEKGHYTLVQDEATSMVWGMPGVAHSLNAYCAVESLPKIAQIILSEVRQRSSVKKFAKVRSENATP